MPTIISTGSGGAGNYGFSRGKGGFVLSIATQNNVNLRTLALAGGWNGTSQVIATVTGNIGSTSTGTASFIITGSFPNGVDLRINSGVYVVGAGGYAGGNGGGALQVTSYTGGALTVTNNGIIGGGGGGGNSSGGGGGGAGITAGAAYGSQATAGTITNGGNGGADGCNAGYVGAGGAAGSAGSFPGGGGGLGGAAASGDSCYGDSDPSDPGGIRYGGSVSGGAAGYAVSGTSSITWLTTGTRYGSVS
jgi:hypothetical protein